MLVEPGRNKHPDLAGNNRESQEHRREERHLDIGEKRFVQSGIDQPPVFPQQLGKRADEKCVNILCEVVGTAESDKQRTNGPHEAGTELDNMLHQRHFLAVETLVH